MKVKTYKEYTLEPHEARIVKICLDYAWHRIRTAQKCGIKGVVRPGQLDKLRKAIEL